MCRSAFPSLVGEYQSVSIRFPTRNRRKCPLNHHRKNASLGELWVETGAVLAQWNGERQHPDTISSWFQKFLKKNNLPPIRFHDLRHTGASLLLNIMDMPMRIVTGRLGHSDPTVTMRFYSHGYEQKDRAAAEGLDALLSSKKE